MGGPGGGAGGRGSNRDRDKGSMADKFKNIFGGLSMQLNPSSGGGGGGNSNRPASYGAEMTGGNPGLQPPMGYQMRMGHVQSEMMNSAPSKGQNSAG